MSQEILPDPARDDAAAASEHPFGAYTAQILATEHLDLLAARSLIWNDAMSRATVFLEGSWRSWWCRAR